MKKALKPIIIISVAVLIILLSKLPKHDKEEIQLFENHRAEFELVNDYIIENFGNEPGTKKSISIIRQAIEISGSSYGAYPTNNAWFGLLADCWAVPVLPATLIGISL